MKNIVINLKRRSDRKENIKKLFSDKNIEYSFFEAIDGKELKGTLELYKLFLNNDFNWRKGVIGCALSHHKLWTNLLEDDIHDNYCIFEDDIILSNNFSQESLNKCEKFINENKVDVLFLGYHMIKNLREKNKDIYNSDKELSFHKYNSKLYIGGFFGYIISKNGAKKMERYISENGIKHGIDYLIKIIKDLNVYECQPFLVNSDWVDNINSDVDSDIQKDYNSLKINTYDLFKIVELGGNKYKFYQGLDSSGNDIKRVNGKSILEIEYIADNIKECVGFNTLGFLKNKINKIDTSPWFNPINDGVYVKIQKENKNIRVKMLCNWCSSSQLCHEWNHMSKGNFKWNDIEITDSNDNIDYFVIINKPLNNNEFSIP